MKNIVVLSICQKVTSNYAQFHFKGYYFSYKIQKIRVMGKLSELHTGDDYLLYLQVLEISETGILSAKLIKAKRII